MEIRNNGLEISQNLYKRNWYVDFIGIDGSGQGVFEKNEYCVAAAPSSISPREMKEAVLALKANRKL